MDLAVNDVIRERIVSGESCKSIADELALHGGYAEDLLQTLSAIAVTQAELERSDWRVVAAQRGIDLPGARMHLVPPSYRGAWPEMEHMMLRSQAIQAIQAIHANDADR